MTILRLTRRDFVAGLGSAAAWPLVGRAQQPMPMVGYLSSELREQDGIRVPEEEI